MPVCVIILFFILQSKFMQLVNLIQNLIEKQMARNIRLIYLGNFYLSIKKVIIYDKILRND